MMAQITVGRVPVPSTRSGTILGILYAKQCSKQ